MQIFVDGLPIEVPDGTNVSEVLRVQGEPTTHVIVEINGSFVHPHAYNETKLQSGDRVEVVYPAFGG